VPISHGSSAWGSSIRPVGPAPSGRPGEGRGPRRDPECQAAGDAMNRRRPSPGARATGGVGAPMMPSTRPPRGLRGGSRSRGQGDGCIGEHRAAKSLLGCVVDHTEARKTSTGFRDRPSTPHGHDERRPFRDPDTSTDRAHMPFHTPISRLQSAGSSPLEGDDPES
jgi:hypothetical protein